jgi:hypothetical protein
MVICNGLDKWKNSRGAACFTHNGLSVVDYILCMSSSLEKIEHFEIGECHEEMSSDHEPVFVAVNWDELHNPKETPKGTLESSRRGRTVKISKQNVEMSQKQLDKIISCLNFLKK